jgi:uncharacterized membrane protein
MGLPRPATENERVLATLLLVFILYFGLDSGAALLLGGGTPAAVRSRLLLSFLASVVGGGLFYLWSAPRGESMERNLGVLKRALSEDEITLVEIIRESEGLTQDSLRFRTGFSKSKVSALLLDLEKKGIVSRVPLGRTYEIFISNWIKGGKRE